MSQLCCSFCAKDAEFSVSLSKITNIVLLQQPQLNLKMSQSEPEHNFEFSSALRHILRSHTVSYCENACVAKSKFLTNNVGEIEALITQTISQPSEVSDFPQKQYRFMKFSECVGVDGFTMRECYWVKVVLAKQHKKTNEKPFESLVTAFPVVVAK